MACKLLCISIVLLPYLFAVVIEGRLSSKFNVQNQIHVVERLEEHVNKLLFPSETAEESLNQQKPVLKLGDFVWSSCSSPDSVVKLSKLSVTDPISIPGNVTISFDSVWGADIVAPLKVVVSVQRKVTFFWVDVPCIGNVGSCTYDDFCAVLPYHKDRPCPEPFKSLELPCYCPGAAGVYKKNNTSVRIPDEHIPEILARGYYNVGAKAWMGDKEVVCLKFSFSLA